MFLTIMVVGLVGLSMMALPALSRAHGHAAHGQGSHVAGHAPARGAAAVHIPLASVVLRWVPSPRSLFSVLALYGAFGNALAHAAHLGRGGAALGPVLPALLVEWFLVRPVWNLLFRFQGQPSSQLEDLLLVEARAVVPFRNGRGMVSIVRDGRAVQLTARLRDDQRALEVRVGDRLRVEDVDAPNERLTVSLSEPAAGQSTPP